jgi:glycosyltransferase involved in cell wall biosynthesis
MKIGYFYPPYYPVTASCSVHGYCLMQALKKRGHEILSCAGDGNPDCINFSRSKLGAFRLAHEADVLYIRASVFSKLPFATLLKCIRPLSLPVVWEMNAPVEELAATLPASAQPDRIIKKEKRRLKILAKLVDAGIGVSDILQQYLLHHMGIKKAYSIPNGSLPEAFTPDNIVETPLQQFSDKFKIIWAGNAKIVWQGIDLIVEAARQLEQTDPDMLFIIIAGESAYHFPMLKNLLVLQQVPFTDLQHYLAAADVCLCPYKNQIMGFYGSSLKCFDYMAAGKPIITTPLGQIKKVISHGVNGIFIDNSVQPLIDSLKMLESDPELRKKLGDNARRSAIEYYNWGRVALETEAVLLDAIKAKSRRPFPRVR